MPWSIPKDYQSRPIAVLGAGVLGRRIAACFAGGGWNVTIFDPSDKSRTDAVAYLNDNITTYLNISHAAQQGTWTTTDNMTAAVENAWLVVEAVPEILSLKIDTFHQLERLAPSDCILGTNSSSYMSSEMLDKVQDVTKQRVLNLHYQMPPQALIVELMTSGSTHEAIFDFLSTEFTKVGLSPYIAKKESTGFIINRIWAAIKREALAVISEGVADAATVDKIFMEQYHTPMGPCVMMDQVGLDTVEHIEQNYVQKRNLPSKTLDWLHENYIVPGRLGDKSDKGGLFPPPAKGEQTHLLVLNVYQGHSPDELPIKQKLCSGQILNVNLDKKGAPSSAIVTGQKIPDGIDIHGDRIYWTTMGVPSENDGAVYSSKLDGSDIQTIIPVGEVHTPKQLHIDSESKKLYFCDREGLRVHRANLDGSQHEILVQTGDYKTEKDKVADQTNWPVGIAISPKLGKIFWTQKGPSKGSHGRIFSAPILPELPENFNPSAREDIELIADDLPEPIDLAIDEDVGEGHQVVLYWTDRGEIPFGNTLNKMVVTAAGSEKRQTLAQGFGEAIGLALDKEKGKVYVADMAGRLWECGLEPGPKRKIYEAAGHAYTGIAMYRS